MALPNVLEVGTRPGSTSPFRDAGLAQYEGYIPEKAFKGDSKELQIIQGLNTALTDQNAKLQEIIDESKKQTTSLHQQLRSSAQGTAAGAYPALPSSMFDPSQQGANPIVRGQPGAGAIAASEARALAYSGAGPSSGEGASTREILEQQGVEEPLVNPLASNLTRAGQMEQPGTIRGQVAQAIQGRLSRANWGDQLEFNEPSMRWRNLATNRFASDAAGQTFMRRQAIQRGAQGFMGAIAEGETVAGAAQSGLGMAGFGTAAKVLGGVGAVMTAGQVANNFVMGQQAANRQVTAVTGGGTMEALGERGRERLFGLSQSFIGGIGGADAAELYRGARDIYGTDRSARGAAEDFGVAMHKIGMDISESLELVRTAAKTGNESLAGLAEGIKGVSSAARTAGISGETARQMFGAAYTAQTQTTGGTTAAELARYETEAVLGLGRNLQDVTLAPSSSMNAIRTQAAMVGMTTNEFLAERGENTVFAAQAQEAYIQKYNPVAQNERATTYINQRVKAIQDTGAKVSDRDWEDISREVQRMNIIDTGSLTNILNQYSAAGVTERNAFEFATRATIGTTTDEEGNVVAGGLNLGDMAAANEASFDEPAKVTQAARDLYQRQRNVGGALGAFTDNKGYENFAEIIEATGGNPEVGINAQKGERKIYLQRVFEGGKRNRVIEAMLKRDDLGGDTRYLVQTADGEREVRFDELIKYHSDQARTAEVVRGSESGQRVHEIFQIEEGKQGASAERGAKTDYGKGENEGSRYEKGGAGGKVTIELSDEARKLINIRTSGAAVGGTNPPEPAETR